MIRTINVECNEPGVALCTEIIYANRMEFSNSIPRPLKLSLMRPRLWEEQKKVPVIVWLCGGSWIEVDRNVFMPEWVWFAKRGYAVVSVDYSVSYPTRYPMQLEDVKSAIRYLRAHADEYYLDAENIAVFGESAGGYLAALTGVTNGHTEFEKGEYLEQSSDVQAVISMYPPCTTAFLQELKDTGAPLPQDIEQYEDVRKYITEDTPPFLIFHGLADIVVPKEESVKLYEALQGVGVETDLIFVENARHTDVRFIQDEVKKLMKTFFDCHLKKNK